MKGTDEVVRGWSLGGGAEMVLVVRRTGGPVSERDVALAERSFRLIDDVVFKGHPLRVSAGT